MRRFLPCVASLAMLVGVGRADESPLVINEFMDVNNDFLADQYGDFSDWIEIYNRADFAIDLAGWHLTDSPDDLIKWQFPSLLIGADSHLLVFASGRDLTDPMSELHTNFKIRAGGEYLALVAPDGMTIHDYNPYPEQFSNTSFGLFPDGGPAKMYMSPSPRIMNVPEPSAIALLGIAAVGLLAFARRNRRR